VDVQEFQCDLRDEKARNLCRRSAKIMERKEYSHTELDQKHSITFLLVWRKNYDAREVVVIIRYLFLSNVRSDKVLEQVSPISYL
jgi:hypothetical protein